MTGDNHNQELEPGVLVLAAAYVAVFLAFILWLAG